MLKQGQVEVEQGKFIPDYRDSLLVHRSVVEDLNSKVNDAAEFVPFVTDTKFSHVCTSFYIIFVPDSIQRLRL